MKPAITVLKESLWGQFGASMDMLKNAISRWPEERWSTDRRFFYVAYHCLVFLDYYLTIPAENFSSPLPFTIKEGSEIPEESVDDIVADRIYTKKELLDYLQASRTKCHALLAGWTEEDLSERFIEKPESGRKNYTVLEIMLYNMRHVQHHAAQLNLFLRKESHDAPDWVSQTEQKL